MKSILLLTFLSLAGFEAARASVALDFGGGNLYGSNGSTLAPIGSLVQLVASTTDNVFTAPSAGSFTGGSSDDLVLFSFTLTSTGTFTINQSFALSGTLTSGDQLMLRWFPTLTNQSSPGGGTAYGQFRTDAVESFSSIPWTVPADGSLQTLNFLTTSQGGAEPESAGAAMFNVIPEPSTVALSVLGFAAFAFMQYRRRTAGESGEIDSLIFAAANDGGKPDVGWRKTCD